MKIRSEAGDFDLRVLDLRASGDDLQMGVKMGVWDAEMHMASVDLARILVKSLRPSVMLFLLLVPVRSLLALRRRGESRAL